MKAMTEREPQLQVASQLGALISEAASRPEVPSSSRTISSALACWLFRRLLGSPIR